MALHYYTYSNFNTATKKLAATIKNNENIFSPHFLVAGHRDTYQVLIEKIASENDIAAHIFFKKPIELVEIIYHIVEAGTHKKHWLSKNATTWLIFDILSEMQQQKIKDYLNSENLKQFSLAEKIGELFESYQQNNPNLIQHWNSHKMLDENCENEHWQFDIWKKLKAKSGNKIPDLVEMFAAIKRALEKNQEKQELLKEKIPHLTLFGSLSYTEDYIDFLKNIGKYIDVYIFHPTVKAFSQHRLLKSLGKYLIYENTLLNNLEASPQIINDEFNTTSNTLLGILQQSILTGKKSENLKIEDDSISIHNHFSTFREVEGLYHYLIKQFSEDKSLMQREICVVCSDINVYAHAIQSHFKYNDIKLDFTLYDSGNHIHDSPYHALSALLKIEADDFTNVKIISLLEYKYIREKFRLTDDLELLKRMLVSANIKHTFTGNKENETRYISWEYGFKRLIYGFCFPPHIQDAVEFDEDKFFLVDKFEDSDTQEIVKLYHFVKCLHEYLQLRQKPLSMQNWISIIQEQTLDIFIDIKDTEPLQFNKILQEMSVANEFLQEKKIYFQLIKHYLLQKLAQMESGEKVGYGGIRFVSPSAFLSAPAKIYAFLGMNGKDFPRKVNKITFDLSGETTPNKSDYDKHFFLNILLASEKKCYISYIGQNISNNSVIPWSSLLDELWASIAHLSSKSQEEFIVKHPLHSFSKKYNADSPNLYMYMQAEAKETFKFKEEKNEEKNTNIFEVDDAGKIIIPLQTLIKFLEDPIEFYYRKVSGIFYTDQSAQLEETEEFNLDTLAAWIVKDSLLKYKLNEIDEPKEELLKLKGKLPLASFGSVAFAAAQNEVDLININEFTDKTSETIKIDLEIGEYRLIGDVPFYYPDLNTLLFATVSSNKTKYQLRALLNYLATLMVYPNTTLYYITNENKPKIIQGLENTKDKLIEYCDLLMHGIKDIVPISCDLLDLKNINFSQLNENVKEVRYPSESVKKQIEKEAFVDPKVQEAFEAYYLKFKEDLNDFK